MSRMHLPRLPAGLSAGRATTVVAAVSGIIAVPAGLHPTVSPLVDACFVFASVFVVTWAAALAPWWMVALAAGVAAIGAPTPLLVAIAVVGVLVASATGIGTEPSPPALAFATLCALQVLARLEVGGFVGASSLLGCGVALTLFVVGIRKRPLLARQRAWFVLGVAGSLLVVGLVGLVVAVLGAREPLSQGNRQARAGLAALQRGDIEGATVVFTDAAQQFAQADEALSSQWAQVARFIPIAAHYQRAGAGVAAGATRVMGSASEALQGIDADTIRVVDGAIDIDAVTALRQPFADLDAAITEFGDVLDGVATEWLAGPLTRRFDDVRRQIGSQEMQLDNARLALEVAPAMLGADRPHHYLVAFTTPAEARGLGGFMGNYAEVTIDAGRIEVTTFGTNDELDEGGPDPEQRRIDGPEEFVTRWGGFGFVDPDDGTTGVSPWKNITMPPDFPVVGEVIASLYPQSGGRELDGVFALDTTAVATLMTFTGPVEVPGVPAPIKPDTVERFIIADQYALAAGDERTDLLDTIAQATLERLMTSALPNPTDLGRAFGPVARAGHLTAWSPKPDEQELFQRLGMAGAMPRLGGGDGISVVIDNAGANKLDAYFQIDVQYDAIVAEASGSVQSTATITLTNSVQPDGLPKYVLSNIYGLEVGTNRTLVSVYSAVPVQWATLDGETVQMDRGATFGWQVVSMFLDVLPGESRTLHLELAGWVEPGPYRLTTRVQPMALPQTYRTSVERE